MVSGDHFIDDVVFSRKNVPLNVDIKADFAEGRSKNIEIATHTSGAKIF